MEVLDEKLWPTETLTTWEAFAGRASSLTERAATGRNILFRGQSQPWTLRPRIGRELPPGTKVGHLMEAERKAIEHFRSMAHLHAAERMPAGYETQPDRREWLVRMQHFGAPTPLIDWSASPYVAAYFAAEKDFDKDGVILVIDADAIDKARALRAANAETARKAGTRSKPDVKAWMRRLEWFTPAVKTMRIAQQQGYFTSAMSVAPHDAELSSVGAILGQWIIPHSQKQAMLLHLWRMNVAAHTLFPGLDGLGRSTADVVRMHLTHIGQVAE